MIDLNIQVMEYKIGLVAELEELMNWGIRWSQIQYHLQYNIN